MRKSDAYLLFIKIRSKFYRSREFHCERIILVLSLGFSYVFFLLQFFESQTLFCLTLFLTGNINKGMYILKESSTS
jgi:hypothetical protein